MARLYQIIARHFSPSEITDLATNLNVFVPPNSEPNAMARELFLGARRNLRLDVLFNEVYSYKTSLRLDLGPNLYELIAGTFNEQEAAEIARKLGFDRLNVGLDAGSLIGWNNDNFFKRQKAETLQKTAVEHGKFDDLLAEMESIRSNLELTPFKQSALSKNKSQITIGEPGIEPTKSDITVIEYEDFDIYIGKRELDGRYPMRLLDSPRGRIFDNPIMQQFPLEDPFFQTPIRFLSRMKADPEELKELGARLQTLLFPGEIWERFQGSYDDVIGKRNKGLRIRLQLHQDSAELARLPWEYAFESRDNRFMALDPKTPIVRYIERRFKTRSLATQKPKLLVVLASPDDEKFKPLDQKGEIEQIRQALDGIEGLHWELLAGRDTYNLLQKKLVTEQFDIFHFIGHGDISNGIGSLAFEDAEGKLKLVSHENLNILLQSRGIKLVVLTACQTAEPGEGDIFKGVAQSLVQADIPAVIAMQFIIKYSIARNFTQRFYEYLAAYQPLDKALTEARINVYGAEDKPLSWGIPVLFMQSPDGIIWEPGTKAVAGESGRATFSSGVVINLYGNMYAEYVEQKNMGDLIYGDKVEGDKVEGDKAGGDIYKGITISGVSGSAISLGGGDAVVGTQVKDVQGNVTLGSDEKQPPDLDSLLLLLDQINQELAAIKSNLEDDDAEEVAHTLQEVKVEVQKEQPNNRRIARKLKNIAEIVRDAELVAAATNQFGNQIEQAIQIAQSIFGG